MYSLKVLITVGFFIFANTSDAKSQCICQTDNHILSEIIFYKIGCKLWANQHLCSDYTEIFKDENIDTWVDYDTTDLILGFVGHWPNSEKTIDFLNNQVLPIIKNNHLNSIEYHNTACYVMSDALLIQNWLRNTQLNGTTLKITGSQTRNIGMWDLFYLGMGNVNATINSDQIDKIEFTNCSQIIDRSCIGKYQAHQTAYCQVENTNQTNAVQCTRKDNHYFWQVF